MSKEAAAGEAAPAKSKKKLIMIVLTAVFLLGGGAGGYMMLSGGGSGEHEEEPKPEPGVVVALDPVTINLADGHYLKMGMALQATAEVHEEPDGSKALDLAINQFSNVEMGELASTAGRKKAKTELLEKVKEAYEGEIMDIYFTEFVMQ